MIAIDSNMWAFYLDRESDEHEYVEEAIENALDMEEIVLNTVIIIEVAHYLIKNLGPVVGKEKLDTFLGYPFTIVDLDYQSTLETIAELAKYSHIGIGGRDATILSLMRHEKIERIMTHDTAFKRINWLEIIDPIPENCAREISS